MIVALLLFSLLDLGSTLGLNQAWDLNTARELNIIDIKLLSLDETNNRMGFAKKR